MAFSSYLPRRSPGWIPTTTTTSSTPSSKLLRRSRKRTLLLNFLATNFLTITLSISLLFFLFILLLFTLPSSKPPNHFLSSSYHSFHHHKHRPSSHKRPSSNQTLLGAVVDITTKDLYDRIEFLDVDGGAWKQGWPVGYKGNEWDSEKLKIFVVPHSHNDPGWRLTVDEYYDKQSRHILDTIVDTLSKDARRKFIWEEMSYLERWWRDATDAKREAFISLAQNGQLEIVGGGWVMNDEVNSPGWWLYARVDAGVLLKIMR